MGVCLFVLLAAAVPLVFISPFWMTLETVTPLVLSAKTWTMRALCAALFVVAAIRLVMPARVELGAAATPMILLAAMLGAAILSALVGQDAQASLRALTNEATMMLAALSAPLFLTTPLRVRLVLAGCLVATLGMAGIVFVSSWMEDGSIIELIYGRDLIEAIRGGDQQLIFELQGGIRRGGSIATLGNPEYVGTFLAGGFLLVGCGVLHGWGWRVARSWPWWLLWVAALGFVGAGILATGTRGGLVAVAAGLVICWLGCVRVRGWWLALGLAVCVFFGLAVGMRMAASLAVLGLAGVLFWQICTGQFMAAWRLIRWPNRVLLILAPVLVVAGLTSQTVPGPWNVGGVTLIERVFRETTAGDDSIRERLTFWMMAGEIVVRRPLLGTGEGMFGPNFHRALVELVENDDSGTMAYAQRLLKTWLAYEAHNDYFEIAADRGLVGLGLFVGLGVALLGGMARITRDFSSPLSALSHTLLITLGGYYSIMATSFPLQTPARMTTFFVLVGLALSIMAIHSRKEEQR